MSLINFKSLSEVALRFFDAVYQVYGVPRRITNETKARIASFHLINESDLPDEQKRQLSFGHYVNADGQQNMMSVIERAIPRLAESAKPEDVEPDWYRNFFSKQCHVSDSQMQEIWARVLAGEANQPGSFSKRTLSILSDLEKEEAEVFAELCRFAWELGGRFTPMIVKGFHNNPIYSRHSISFPAVSHFQTIGLVQFSHLSPLIYSSDYSSIGYFGRKLELLDARNGFRFGHGEFSVCGRELCAICDREPIDGLWEYVTENYKDVFGPNVAGVRF